MEPKVVSISRIEYIPAPYTGNNSGYRPIGDLVLVRPDMAADKAGSVLLTDEMRDRMHMTSMSGVVVATGDGAFAWSSDRIRPFEGDKPKAGDRICFDKYAGRILTGDDGVEYRLMTDVNIGAVRA